jgi:hypothetical protein
MLEHVEERDHVEGAGLDGSSLERTSDPGDARHGQGGAGHRVKGGLESAHAIPRVMRRTSERAASGSHVDEGRGGRDEPPEQGQLTFRHPRMGGAEVTFVEGIEMGIRRGEGRVVVARVLEPEAAHDAVLDVEVPDTRPVRAEIRFGAIVRSVDRARVYGAEFAPATDRTLGSYGCHR